MKLITKYNRVYIPVIIVTLLISSVAYYFILHYALIYQLDKDLRVEQQEIIQHIRETGKLPEASNYKDQLVEFHPTTITKFQDVFSNEKIYDKKEDETNFLRRIDFLVEQKGVHFIATVKKSERETEDIVQLILSITLSVIVVLLLILFIFNRFLLRNLWKPFYHTLRQVKHFNVLSKNTVNEPDTNITEFKELNETVFAMEEKVIRDYQTLKNFTENASHEIQTPLAIIKNKIELLLQSENLEEPQLRFIKSINDAATKLSRLNQSLLLLAKIENNQFENRQHINFSCLLNSYINDFEELAFARNIHIIKNICPEILVNINESLAEILITNLLLNAIKHNYKNGQIEIELQKRHLRISNTGEPPQNDTIHFFERFKKASASHDSLGLGLSIVKSICDTCNFSISYQYLNERHLIEIGF
jgi:signal transduction histidine kinase